MYFNSRWLTGPNLSSNTMQMTHHIRGPIIGLPSTISEEQYTMNEDIFSGCSQRISCSVKNMDHFNEIFMYYVRLNNQRIGKDNCSSFEIFIVSSPTIAYHLVSQIAINKSRAKDLLISIISSLIMSCDIDWCLASHPESSKL